MSKNYCKVSVSYLGIETKSLVNDSWKLWHLGPSNCCLQYYMYVILDPPTDPGDADQQLLEASKTGDLDIVKVW